MPKSSRGSLRISRGTSLAVAALFVGFLLFLGYVIWAFQATWRLNPGVRLSVHGWIAMGLAFVLTGLLGGGLMWLAFYSSRKGYDEHVGEEDEHLDDES